MLAACGLAALRLLMLAVCGLAAFRVAMLAVCGLTSPFAGCVRASYSSNF